MATYNQELRKRENFVNVEEEEEKPQKKLSDWGIGEDENY